MKPLSPGDPRFLGGYRLLAALGEGGMGRVYLARSGRGRMVAVKVVRPELARHPDFRRRFAREIRAAQRVGTTQEDSGPDGGASRARWTAAVLDFDTEAALPWVATGYIAGPSLAEVVDEQYGPLPEWSVTGLACGLGGALRAIHAAGLVHRDLKPSNVLVTIDGPRVIDFGIARALDGTISAAGALTGTGSMLGSPGFMSSEQIRGMPVTPKSDVFCLGAVLTYAATGRLPFGGAESGVHAVLFRIVEEEPDLTGLSGSLLATVRACLAKEPGDRPDLDDLTICSDGALHEPWLPGEVLARLGRHAVRLLEFEEPVTDETRGSVHRAARVAGHTTASMPPHRTHRLVRDPPGTPQGLPRGPRNRAGRRPRRPATATSRHRRPSLPSSRRTGLPPALQAGCWGSGSSPPCRHRAGSSTWAVSTLPALRRTAHRRPRPRSPCRPAHPAVPHVSSPSPSA